MSMFDASVTARTSLSRCRGQSAEGYRLRQGATGAARIVFPTEVDHGALAPSADEVIVEGGADCGADDRDEPSGPALDNLAAGLHGDALDDPRHEAVHHLFFQ